MRRFLSIISLLAAGALPLQAQDYFQEYGNNPVPVLNLTQGQGANETLTLVGLERGDLLLRFPNRPGEVGLPLNTENLQLQIQFPNTVNQAYRQIEQGQYEEAIVTLRPMVYPVMKYFEVPPESINVHEIIERYLFALISAKGHDAEVAEILRRIPLKTAQPVFSLHALRYVTQLVEQGKQEDAIRLLNRIPMSTENEANNQAMLKLVMQFADELREDGNLDEALFLYDRLQQAKGTQQATLATLWSAYCNVSMERYQLASIFVDRAGEFTAEDMPYSLAQLVRAKIQLEKLDYTAAMEQASQGVVAVDVSYNWAPELIYTTGLCYENLDFPDTAREVYNEIVLFYPENKWAKEAENALLRLPPPAPKAEPEPGA